MVGKFEEEYMEVLQSIEQAIYDEYIRTPLLVDYQVDKALDGLQRYYTAEMRLRPAPALKLNAEETRMFEAVKLICELYLGRDPEISVGDTRLNVEETIACIKRIQRSVHLMRDKGRQGYLNFIANFFAS